MEGIIGRMSAFLRNAVSADARNLMAKGEAVYSPKKDEPKQKQNELIQRIQETGREIEAVRSCFDLETDDDLIESYIMEMVSLEKRYDYLIKEAKREKIAAF